MSKGAVTIAGIKHLTKTLLTFQMPTDPKERAAAEKALYELQVQIQTLRTPQHDVAPPPN